MTNILLLIIIGYLAYKEIMARKPEKKEDFTEEQIELLDGVNVGFGKEELTEEFDKLWAYKVDDAVNSYKRGDE